MCSAEVGAVGGVGLRGLGAICEGAEANAATGGHLAELTEFEGDCWSGFEVSCGGAWTITKERRSKIM